MELQQPWFCMSGLKTAMKAFARLLPVILAGTGCDDPSNKVTLPTSRPATQPSAVVAASDKPATTTPASGSAKPGFITGRVVRQDGTPISVDGARVAVSLMGVSPTGDKLEAFPQVQSDGTFEARLETGTYRTINATVDALQDGRYFRFRLEPVFQIDDSIRSESGIRQDFIWKISGQRPHQRGDLRRADAWYGGAVILHFAGFRKDLEKTMPLPPKGTKFIFTFTPSTPLIDGRPSKSVVVERLSDGLVALDDKLVTDIPLARYTLTGEVADADGSRRNLLFRQADKGLGKSVAVNFQPNLAEATVEPLTLYFTMPE